MALEDLGWSSFPSEDDRCESYGQEWWAEIPTRDVYPRTSIDGRYHCKFCKEGLRPHGDGAYLHARGCVVESPIGALLHIAEEAEKKLADDRP